MGIRTFQHPISKSAAVHLLLILFVFVFYVYSPQVSIQDEPISVSIVEPNQNSKENQMIVQPSEGEMVKEAKKNAYLSDQTRTVKDERSASKTGSNKPRGVAVPMVNQPSKPVTLSDLGMKISTKQEAPSEKQKNWASNSLGEDVRGGQYIQGLKEGETSALNTKEFVFFSYFERVRKQLDQTWQPLVRGQIEKIYKNGRHLASQTDFTTRTLVTINSKGDIVRVQVLQASGTMDLDSAAINALNKAGPYPNPPKGLMDETGNAQIRWDFILKT